MEIKLKIHLPWVVYLDSPVGANSDYTKKPAELKPACGKKVKLYSQEIELVNCEACLRRYNNG